MYLKKKAVSKRKKCLPRCVISIGGKPHRQHTVINPYAPSAHKHYRWFNPNYRRCRNVATYSKVNIRNTYSWFPHFRPGDTVYTIVHNGRFGTKIIKDIIDEVYSFGVGNRILKEYWLRYTYDSSGLEAGDVYANYNSAKFFQYY